MSTNTITTFLFGESHIRSLNRSGEPWFVAKDICAALELGNVSQAIKGNPKAGALGLDEDEAAIMNLDTRSDNGVVQTRHILLVNESGLYALIFKSRKAEARRFRKWVTSEVLPAIRRSGSYHRGHQAFLSLIQDQIALGVSPDLAAKMAGKLTHVPKDAFQGASAPTARQDAEIEFLLSLMKPGVSYTIAELTELIPAGHPYTEDSISSRHSRLGKLLTRACSMQRVEKLYGRNNRYRLPAIAAFPLAAP